MNTIEKLLLSGALIVGASTFATAQVSGGDLNLTTEQQEKWDSIHEQYKKEWKIIMLDKALSGPEKSKKLEDLSKREMEASKAVLTPQQLARFEELNKKKQ